MPDPTSQPNQSQSYSTPGQQPGSGLGTVPNANQIVDQYDHSGNDPAVELIRSKIRDLYSDEPDAKQEIVEASQHTHPGSKHQQYMNQLHGSGKTLAEIQVAWHNYYSGLPDNEKYEVWQEFYVVNGNNPVNQQVATLPAVADQQSPSTVSGQTVAHQAVANQPATNPLFVGAAQPHIIPADPTPTALPQPVPAGKFNHRPLRARGAKAAVDQAAARLKSASKTSNASASDIKKRILSTVKTVGGTTSARSNVKLKAKHHIHSLLFGLGCGAAVLFVVMFSFFNERVLAPIYQPSRKINDTPVIVDVANTVVSGDPKVIIPKINLEIPVDYSQTTTDEKAIELALDKGIVHYPTTVKPGQTGNAAYFGHSSNNIFNPGKYKFAFVLLHEMNIGDTFYLTNDGVTYAYKIFSKKIVEPSEVSVLLPTDGHPSTATLITCDPPGTSLHRLVVVGDQISPDAGGNTAPTSTPVETATTTSLPANGPTLWSRIWGSVF